MTVYTEKISLSRTELLRGETKHISSIIRFEPSELPVEDVLCGMIARMIDENKEAA